MAIWCTNCRAQQGRFTEAFASIPAGTAEYVVLTVDPSEGAADLAALQGRPRVRRAATPSLARTCPRRSQAEFGANVLNPPSVPLIFVSAAGDVTFTTGPGGRGQDRGEGRRLMGELVAVFAAGLASAASPCLLPLYPGFLAYLSANAGSLAGRRATGLLGLLVLAGLLTTMVVAGAVLVIVAVPVGRVASLLVPFVDGLLLVLGVLLIAGRNPFNRLPGLAVPIVRNPFGQAYVYGLMLGPIALPCAGPFLAALLAVSVGVGDALLRLGTFVVFGLGFGLPLVVLSLLAGARQRQIVGWVTRHHRPIELLSGAVLIAVALWDLRENWDGILFTLGIG